MERKKKYNTLYKRNALSSSELRKSGCVWIFISYLFRNSSYTQNAYMIPCKHFNIPQTNAFSDWKCLFFTSPPIFIKHLGVITDSSVNFGWPMCLKAVSRFAQEQYDCISLVFRRSAENIIV